MKVKGQHIWLSLVTLVLGFLVAFSYQYTEKTRDIRTVSDQQWNREQQYRKMLNQQQEKNLAVEKQLYKLQSKVSRVESKLSAEQSSIRLVVNDVDKLRQLTSKVPLKGGGLRVTLEDASYVPTQENANQYIVHERHLLQVINELRLAGAKAVAVNGKRFTHRSYLVCNGPVVEIDGQPFPAPFVIEAIGDANTMQQALTISGGVAEVLVQDNITVKLEQQSHLRFEANFEKNN